MGTLGCSSSSIMRVLFGVAVLICSNACIAVGEEGKNLDGISFLPLSVPVSLNQLDGLSFLAPQPLDALKQRLARKQASSQLNSVSFLAPAGNSNNSVCTKTLQLQMGSTGFGAEVMQIVFARQYAEHLGRAFILDDSGWNFKCGKGKAWECYFEEFQNDCAVVAADNLIVSNSHNKSSAAQKPWSEMLAWAEEQMLTRSSFMDQSAATLAHFWKLNEQTSSSVESLIKAIHLPSKYMAVHMRRGDKLLEESIIPAQAYVNKLKGFTAIAEGVPVFVATDQWPDLAIAELKSLQPQWNYTALRHNRPWYDGFGENITEVEMTEEALHFLTD